MRCWCFWRYWSPIWLPLHCLFNLMFYKIEASTCIVKYFKDHRHSSRLLMNYSHEIFYLSTLIGFIVNCYIGSTVMLLNIFNPKDPHRIAYDVQYNAIENHEQTNPGSNKVIMITNSPSTPASIVFWSTIQKDQVGIGSKPLFSSQSLNKFWVKNPW